MTLTIRREISVMRLYHVQPTLPPWHMCSRPHGRTTTITAELELPDGMPYTDHDSAAYRGAVDALDYNGVRPLCGDIDDMDEWPDGADLPRWHPEWLAGWVHHWISQRLSEPFRDHLAVGVISTCIPVRHWMLTESLVDRRRHSRKTEPSDTMRT